MVKMVSQSTIYELTTKEWTESGKLSVLRQAAGTAGGWTHPHGTGQPHSRSMPPFPHLKTAIIRGQASTGFRED